jgi:hypothetical protein
MRHTVFPMRCPRCGRGHRTWHAMDECDGRRKSLAEVRRRLGWPEPSDAEKAENLAANLDALEKP